VIIDAVLGTGLHVPLKPWVKVVIAAINQAGRPVYALDLPSGVDTDNGQIDETAVRADATIALGGTKWGHWCYPGASYRGRLVLADIGLPDHPTAAHLIDSAFVSAALIPLAPDGHKYRRGRLVVVGGSADMPGAPQMAASAATRMGVGLVELMVPRSIVSRLSVSPAMLVHPIDEDENGSLCMTEVEKTHLTRAQAVVLGPGLGRQSAVEWLRWLQIHQKPIVIDADGLALLAAHPEVWDWPQAVLTPHEGEAAGLLGVSALEIRSDRLGALLSLLQRFNSTVVLKGAFTLLGSRQQVYVNPSGIPQLATAGSGDVLAGIIGALLASGYGTEAAAAIGVYIHGQAARLARLSHGDSLIAPDLIEALGSGWTDLVLAGNGGEESVVWI
jgi:NAD(P)H-hydrate epimerase